MSGTAIEAARGASHGLAEAAVPLRDGLRGLSLALDLAMGRHGGHAQAVAALAVRVGGLLGLPEAELGELASASLLKDAGCPSTRATFVREVGVDDVAFHRASFALEEYTPRSFAALLWDLQRGRSDRATARVARWTRSLLGLKRYAAEYQRASRRNAEAARIATQLDCPTRTIAALASVGEHWDGSGSPGALTGERIPIGSRIIAACQIALIWGEAGTPEEVAARLLRLRPGRFDPEVVRLIARIARATPLNAPRAWIDALATECGALPAAPDDDRPLDAHLLATTFSEMVDVKSEFTASHSLRVAGLAGAMAALRVDGSAGGASISAIILAGLLHDLGKLAVPTTILDKPGPLTPEERAVLARHPADSARIIGAIGPWGAIGVWAGAHHERPDGAGYHRGLSGEAIPPVGRLLAAADAFDAMVADRPYRAGMPPDEALRRIRAGRGAQFDPVAAELLEAVVKSDVPGAPGLKSRLRVPASAGEPSGPSASAD